MGSRRFAAALLLLAACKAELMGDPNQTADADTSQPDAKVYLDAAIDAPLVLGAWGTATLVPGASDDALQEDDATLSSDKLEIYFKRVDAGDANLYMMTRATATSTTWSAPTPIGVLNGVGSAEESPRLSQDNLTLYFGRDGDIMKSTRTAVGQPWGAPAPVTTLNTGGYEKWADVCSTGYAIVSRDTGGGNGQDLYEGTITAGAPNAITAFNTTNAEQGTLLSADCTHIYFQSNRDNAQFDLFEASRTNATAAWQNPSKMLDFNTATLNEEDPWVSSDQRQFVYVSNVNGTKDVFISTR